MKRSPTARYTWLSLLAFLSGAIPVAALAATVESLPLKEGYFVKQGTPCESASDATLTLHLGHGLNTGQAHCRFSRIEKIGGNTYRAVEECSSRGESVSRKLEFTVSGPTSFAATDASDSSKWAARHCPQESLPEPWRTEDLIPTGITEYYMWRYRGTYSKDCSDPKAAGLEVDWGRLIDRTGDTERVGKELSVVLTLTNGRDPANQVNNLLVAVEVPDGRSGTFSEGVPYPVCRDEGGLYITTDFDSEDCDPEVTRYSKCK